MRPAQLVAQQLSDDAIEVYLNMRHRGVINTMVTAYYYNNEFYLPVGELFSLLQIDYNTKGLLISGKYATEQTPYTLNFENRQVQFGKTQYQLNLDDYLISDLDNYLQPRRFYEIFGLNFTIDFNNLSLSLETNTELPVIANALRRQRRSLADRNRLTQDERYPLLYGRQRPFFDGGFLDYNFSGSYSQNSSALNFNTNIGLQIYGGDFQGLVFGNHANNNTNIATSNMRWRYRYVDNPALSTLIIGQTTSDGITKNGYTGIRISNEPIEPRRFFDEFEIEGNTIPEAEVELYLNNLLIDFKQSDELGNYRFLAPVTYGSSQLSLNIYGPTGQVIEQSQRIQVPFNFQPKGVFNYQINAGRMDNPVFGSTKQGLTAQGHSAYGVTNWLTYKAGVEYYEGYHTSLPTFTSTISSRIFSQYLLTLEAATEAYYRGAVNVIYPNSASLNFDYTYFNSGAGIYNSSNDNSRIMANAFYPFSIAGIPFNVRIGTFTRMRNSQNNTTLRLNLGTRLGKVNLRFGYTDRLINTWNFLDPSSVALLESSATYNFSRSHSIPVYLRGVYLRANMRFYPVTQQMETVEITSSQNILKMGRLQLTYNRNFIGNFNVFRASLVLDFNKFRTSTNLTSNRNSFHAVQNIRGSIGYDTNYNNTIFTSRDQVGRSGAAIKLFVDNDASNSFGMGDETISDNVIRVNRSGASSILKNGVLYYLQMQPYFFYNMELNKGGLRNPMLVPEVDKFGIITDPNRFKKIEIPFYMSGVVGGAVSRVHNNGMQSGVAGLKLNLQKIDDDFYQEIRTFSDGSFYAYEVPPGNYVVSIDSSQLQILDVYADADSLWFQVLPIPEGDFVEGLTFLLYPNKEPEPVIEEIEITTLEEGLCTYILQLGSFSTESAAKTAASYLPANANPFIVYNAETRLYAVRVTAYPSLSEASEMVESLYANNYLDVAVLHDCSESPDGAEYNLQVAAFSNAYRAGEYMIKLKKAYGLDTLITKSEKDGLNHIILATYHTFNEARAMRDSIWAEFPGLELYIDKQSNTSTISANYHYLMQLGVFESEHQASAYAYKFRELTGFSVNIIVDERGTASLFIDTPFTRWNHTIRTRNEIGRIDGLKLPIIHLSEIDLRN